MKDNKDTVIIDLKEYLELYNLEKELFYNNKALVIKYHSNYGSVVSKEYYNHDEVAEQLKNDIDICNKFNVELINKNQDLSLDYKKLSEKLYEQNQEQQRYESKHTISDHEFSKMSIFDFLEKRKEIIKKLNSYKGYAG